MADLLIEEDRAQRIIARILRDNLQVLPDKANTVATTICSGLSAAMTTPSKPSLSGWRIISSYPPYGDGDKFTEDLRARIADVNYRVARELWELVWKYGRDLPPDIAPPRQY
jgi:hypothetical protein